jgi:protein-tyrosine phosphatase
MKFLAAFLFVLGRLALAAGIDNATCEQTGPTTYHLEFQAPADAGAIAIYASSRADRIDSAQPVLTTRRSPADVTVPAGASRVYFHLKPQSGPTRVVATRRIPLDGAANFRDLGGYRTTDGHHVKWGTIYRSNSLAQVTAKDYDLLGHLGIRLVCDFRVDSERRTSPTKWQGADPPEIAIESIDTIKYFGTNREAGYLTIYQRIADDGAMQFADVLRRIIKGDLPTLVHCTSGKDRTGTFSAFLLTLLGVPRDVVQADYELSNKYLLKDRVNGLSPSDLHALWIASGVDPAWLGMAFTALDSKYGSFDNYLHNTLGLSDADLAALRSRLLE